MKAIVCSKYGPPEIFQLKEIAVPAPKANELLIHIHATAVNSADWRLRKAKPWAVRLFFGFSKPRQPIMGGVFSGEVVAIGKAVTKFKKGDLVYGSAGIGFGTYAEYKCISQDAVLCIKPDSITHAEAAVIPFGATAALYFIRKAFISKGQKVLVYGASGAIGTAAIQLAVELGAEVTAVCSSANFEMVKSLGVHKTIDYTKQEMIKIEERYDVIIETVNKLPYPVCIKLLKSNGVLTLCAAGILQMIRGHITSHISNKKVITGVMKESPADLAYINELVKSGAFRAVIDRTYLLEEMTAAHRYVEGGHKKGNVSIIVTRSA